MVVEVSTDDENSSTGTVGQEGSYRDVSGIESTRGGPARTRASEHGHWRGDTVNDSQLHGTRSAGALDDSRGGHATETDVPAPGWLTDDTSLGTTVDRQVLVVGQNLPGLALTLLLDRAGYEPVLVGAPDPPVRSQLTCLSSLAVRLLDAIGVGDAVLDCGCHVTTASVSHVDGSNAEANVLQSGSEAAAPRVIRTRDLRRILREHLAADIARESRSLVAVSRDEGGLEVTFDDGVREWFDVVVAADSNDPPVRTDGTETTADARITQYETTIETDRDSPDRIVDVWTTDALLQLIPHPDDRSDVFRITATGEIQPSRLDGGQGSAHFPFDPGEAVDAVTEAGPLAVRQARVSTTGSNLRWGSGRIPRCGPAALPVAPASGLGAVLALEDAWTLTEELARGPRSVSAVVDNYARRRRTRIREIRRRATGAVSRQSCFPSDTLPTPLAVTRDMRAAAVASSSASSAVGLTDPFERF